MFSEDDGEVEICATILSDSPLSNDPFVAFNLFAEPGTARSKTTIFCIYN